MGYTKNTYIPLLSELSGTFLLVLFGCGSLRIMDLGLITHPMSPHIAFGAILIITIPFLAQKSGAHFNPVVSLAFLIQQKISLQTFKYYVTFQFLGAILACLALKIIFPNSMEYGATIPKIQTTYAFLFEALITTVLVSVILFVSLVAKFSPLLSGISIGTTVALCSFFAGSSTGASMNPARSFAPNFFQNQSHTTWLYFMAPLAGTLIASMIFYFSLKQKKES